VVFSDDFEDGEISDWTLIEEDSGYVAAEQYPGPDWSLNVHSPSGTSSRAQATSPTFDMADSLDYDISMEFAFETPIHWIEVVRNKHINTVIDNCPGAYCTFRCRYGGSNYIIDNLYPYASYSLRYEVHPGTEAYDVYVGDVLKRTCEFDYSSIPFPQFRVGDFESGSSNYGVAIYDDFVITQVPAGVGRNEDPGATWRLGQNSPNPFVAATIIEFELARPGLVDLKVYDAAGRLVKTLVCDTRPAGAHSVSWNAYDKNGKRVGPGIYFVRMEAGDLARMKKIILLE
jgi:hypothetical protein